MIPTSHFFLLLLSFICPLPDLLAWPKPYAWQRRLQDGAHSCFASLALGARPPPLPRETGNSFWRWARLSPFHLPYQARVMISSGLRHVPVLSTALSTGFNQNSQIKLHRLLHLGSSRRPGLTPLVLLFLTLQVRLDAFYAGKHWMSDFLIRILCGEVIIS